MRRSTLVVVLIGLAAACAPAATQIARDTQPPRTGPAPAPRGDGVVELSSGVGVVCARYADGQGVCFSANRGGALDLEAPKPLPTRGLRDLQVVEGRVWVKDARSRWTSSVLESRFVDAPVPPLAPASLHLAHDGLACGRGDDGRVRCDVHSKWRAPATAADKILRLDFPEAGKASTLALARIGGGQWLCGLLANREVVCWGMSGERVRVASGVKKIAGGERLCVHFADGRLACARDDADPSAKMNWDVIATHPSLLSMGAGREIGCAQLAKDHVECWWWRQKYDDNADAGTLYSGELRGQPTRVSGLESVAALSVGESHACALESAGKVSCWGRVTPTPPEQLVSRRVSLTRATAVALGGRHACAIQHRNAWCWGDNQAGQLGRSKSSVRVVEPEPIDDLGPVVELALGERHTCVRTELGAVHCFGDPSGGALGRAGNKSELMTRVAGVDGATQLAAHDDATCAVIHDAKVVCWGKLAGAGAPRPTTEIAQLRGASEVSIDADSVCARIEQKVLCVGRRAVGAKKPDVSPRVAQGVAQLSGPCLRMSDGRVTCTSLHSFKDYEDVERSQRIEQAVPELQGATKIWTGASAVCGSRADGTTRCKTVVLETRDEPTAPPQPPSPTSPLQLPGTLRDVVHVAVGPHQVCAVTGAGQLVCSGGFDAPEPVPWADSEWTWTAMKARLPDVAGKSR